MKVIQGGKRAVITDAQRAARQAELAETEMQKIKRVGRAALIDWERYQETGEVVPVEGIPYVAKRKARHPYGERWLAMNQVAVMKIATDKTLKAETLRVWLYLLSILDFENWIAVKQRDAAAILNMRPSHISEAFSELEQRGMIERGERVLGGAFAWSLNEEDAWKGTVPNLEKAMRARARRERDGKDRKKTLKVVDGGKATKPAKPTMANSEQLSLL